MVVCQSQGQSGFQTVCCPRPLIRPGVRYEPPTCCNGHCCAPGQLCCYNRQAGRTDCWDSALCDRPR
jgi:hypothetical protein